MTSRLLLCLSLLISMAAHAQSTPKKVALAEQLVKLLHFDRMFDDYLKECSTSPSSTLDAAVSYREHPESFDGLSPQSAYWGEVDAIYGRYLAKICEYSTGEKVTQYFTQQFAEHASEEDLRAALAFQSSPTGRRLQAITLEANKAFQEEASKLIRKAHDDAEDQYQREIAEIIRKFHADPK